MSPTPKLNAALVKLQADLPKVSKSKTADVPTKAGGRYVYTYADLAAVSGAVMGRLAELGLSFTARPTLDGGAFVLAYELRHESGEEIGGVYPLNRGTPQAVGSEITYARRYALCSVTGVAPEDDDDAAAASAAPPSAQRARSAPQRTAQRAARTAEPPLPGERGFDQAAGTPLITPAQLRALNAALGDLKNDRVAALARYGQVIGRAVESSKDLTVAEASRVIDDLKRAGATPATDDAVPEGFYRDDETGELIPADAGVDPAEYAGGAP